MRYKVVNGKEVQVWFDNWHPCGPMLKRFGSGLVYDAAKLC